MESADPFATTEIEGTEDPFAGTDFGGDGFDPVPDPVAPDPAGGEMMPVVNAEGETIGEAPAMSTKPPASFDPVRKVFLDADGNETSARPAQTPPPLPADPAADGEAYQEARQAPAPATPAPEQPEEAPAPVAEAPEPPQAPVAAHDDAAEHQARMRAIAEREAQEKRDALVAAETAAQNVPQLDPQHDVETGEEPIRPPLPEAEPTPPAAAGPTEDEEPLPAEKTDDKGRVTHRPYVVLRPTAPGKYEEVTWYVDADGKMGEKGPGMKLQRSALVRSAKDALVMGYKAVGAPPDGAVLIAVSRANFELTPIRPKPPEPSKTRLQIG